MGLLRIKKKEKKFKKRNEIATKNQKQKQKQKNKKNKKTKIKNQKNLKKPKKKKKQKMALHHPLWPLKKKKQTKNQTNKQTKQTNIVMTCSSCLASHGLKNPFLSYIKSDQFHKTKRSSFFPTNRKDRNPGYRVHQLPSGFKFIPRTFHQSGNRALVRPMGAVALFRTAPLLRERDSKY